MTYAPKPITLGILLFVGSIAGCLDDAPMAPDQNTASAPTIVLSDTASAGAFAASGADWSIADSSTSRVTYVSLAPGAVPNGKVATVRNLRTGTVVTAAMTNGGLDPVRVEATAGDTLETSVQLSGVAVPTTLSNVVPARRRPTVVRTVPPRGKTDVPMNSRIEVVFSEPIDPLSVSAGTVRLMRGSTAVPGRLVVGGAGVALEIIPDQLLAASQAYQIVVTDGVRDLDGDALERSVIVDFSTGSSIALASVSTEQTALLSAGNGEVRTFQLSAIQRADGSFSGTFSIFYPATGGRSGGRVTCFTVVDGGAVWMAGVIEDAGNPALVGIEFGWRAVDNGPPQDGVPDQLSLAFPIGPEGLVSAQSFCDNTPLVSPTQGEIALRDVQGGDIVVRGSHHQLPPPPPDTGISRIAFGATSGGIHVMNADGLGARAITTTPGDFHPAWSPDGRKIAFSRKTDDANFDIYVVNADGSGLKRLTSSIAYEVDPAWSPDGSRIAFHRDGAIYVMNASTGSEVTQVTTGTSDSGPTWSPDGSRIAFSRWYPTAHIFAINTDGSGLTQLTNGSGIHSSAEWSPDGARITFVRHPDQYSSGAIHVMNADGTGMTKLTIGGQMPAWSPDSKMIIYEWYGLNVINADGSGLTKRGSGFTPAWSRVGSMPPAPRPSVSISIAGGEGQADTVRTTLAQPLSVRLARDDGAPAAGVRVSWLLTGNKGPVASSLSSNSAFSDAEGIASVRLTLGSHTGRLSVQAAVTDGTARSAGVAFTATAKAGAPVSLHHFGSDSLVTLVNSTIEHVVLARDGHGTQNAGCPGGWCGNGVAGAPIDWAVTAGDGTISPNRGMTAPDSAYSGYPISRATHSVGPNEGTTTATATASTIPGAPRITFTAFVVTRIVAVAWGGFTPDTVSVPAGKTIGWEWNPSGDSDDVHDISFEDNPNFPVSSPTRYGGFHIRKFDGAPRTIRYRCTWHSTGFTDGEVGVVTVR